MSPNETARFEAEPFHREAVRVRRWDDAGKMAGLITPELADYVALIEHHSLGTNIASRT
jgi:predicted HD phosphohydrolase